MQTSKVALSGSGFRFFAHVGALACLDKHTEIVELAGTSGGSLIAAIYASGYGVEEMVDLMSDIHTDELIKFNFSALFDMGICKGKSLETNVYKVLGNKTFKDMKIPLRVAATNLNTGSLALFSPHTTPDVKVKDAVRASCAIPLVYTPYKIDGVRYVDGGLVNNIPVNTFTDSANTEVYAINLQSKDMYPFFSKVRFLPEIALRLVDIMIQSNTQMHLETAMIRFKNAKVINIDTSAVIKPYDEAIDMNEKFNLYQLGFDTVKNQMLTKQQQFGDA